jgi:hypothetical protein
MFYRLELLKNKQNACNRTHVLVYRLAVRSIRNKMALLGGVVGGNIFTTLIDGKVGKTICSLLAH